MSFVVTKRPIAAKKLEIVVNDEKGSEVKLDFVAQYIRHTPNELADLQDGMTNQARLAQGLEPVTRRDGTEVPKFAFTSDIDFIKAKMSGWLSVRDASGDSIPFSPESLDQVLTDWPELVIPLFHGFFEAHQGAKQKN